MGWFPVPRWVRALARMRGDASDADALPTRTMRLPVPVRGTLSAPDAQGPALRCRVVDVGPNHANLRMVEGPAPDAGRTFRLEFTAPAPGGQVRARARITGAAHPAPGGTAMEVELSGLSEATRRALARMVRGAQGYGGWETDAELNGKRLSRLARGGAAASLVVVAVVALFWVIAAATGVVEDPPIDRLPSSVRDRAVRMALRDSPAFLNWWNNLSEERKQDVIKKGRAVLRSAREKERDER